MIFKSSKVVSIFLIYVEGSIKVEVSSGLTQVPCYPDKLWQQNTLFIIPNTALQFKTCERKMFVSNVQTKAKVRNGGFKEEKCEN